MVTHLHLVLSVIGLVAIATVAKADEAGVDISNSDGVYILEDGASIAYTVVLRAAPQSAVTVRPSKSFSSDEIVVVPASLTFTTVNWSTAQTVTVVARSDADEVADYGTIVHAVESSDTDYDGMRVANVQVFVVDDECFSSREPTALSVSFNAVLGRVTLNWTAEEGRAVMGWQYRYALGSGTFGQWKELVTGDSVTSRTLAMNLVGRLHRFEIRSWDEGGVSRKASAKIADYDVDGDGLIEISNLEQLNAVRWDLDGDGEPASGKATDYAAAFPHAVSSPGRLGCPSTGCEGYELAASLDFDAAASYADTSNKSGWTTGAGWTPLGDSATKFTATFDGNGRVVANLFISNASGNSQGLFGVTGDEAEVLDLGVASASVRGSSGVGALVGENRGRILRSWSSTGSGEKVEGWGNVGGLVGVNRGAVVAGRSAAAAAARTSHQWATVGGLVGQNFNRIVAARASGGVTGLNQGYYGGLVGYGNGGSVGASYAAGAVTSTGGSRGGLIGGTINAPTVTASYWDTDATGIADDGDGLAPEGRTTTQLQAPTGYAGLYADWNVDLGLDDDFSDGDADDPWHFGGDGDYPRLRGLPRLDAVATGLSTASLTLSDWGGDWWYRADTGPHANCSSTKVAAGTATADLSGLSAGTDYVYAAYMDAACSVEIASASLKGLPSAPGKPTATAEDRRVALTWTSGGDGGSPVLEWQVSRKAGDGAWGAWKAVPGSGPSTTSHTVTGLTNATSYRFRVRAVNAVGNGAASPASGAATPALSKASAPPAPGKPTVAAGVRSATLGWTSNGDGGSAITRWEYVKKTGAGAWETTWTAIAGGGPSTTSYTVTGLTNGTEYRFKVRAVNAVGNGAESSASDAVTPSAAPALAAAATSATAATLTLSNWSAVWRYKADKAPHASCSSQVAANAAASLTGLSSGGVYGYAAYSDSGCATRLATATLSMPSLSAQRKSATEATLTLSNWSALWHYKATSGGGPDTACSTTAVPANTPTKDLSGLTTDTTYTYKAYADSACSSAKELGSATFTAGKTDYDADDNGLIEISNLEQLNAVRWDLDGNGSSTNAGHATAFPGAETTPGNMGCPSTGCDGYELAASLDFSSASSYASGSVNTSWTTGTGWTPLGDTTTNFTGTFDGNGRVVANLYINRPTVEGASNNQGLFGVVGATGKVLNLGVAGASVIGSSSVGALVGSNAGTIRHSWSSTGASEQIRGAWSHVGGLVGANHGTIAASGSSAKVSAPRAANDTYGGGLAGSNTKVIIAGLASGAVAGGSNGAFGALAGHHGGANAEITTSLATGAVTGTGDKDGLVGGTGATHSFAGESYWDSQTTGIDDDADTASPEGRTTTQLQSPTGYSGIYSGWNRNVDDTTGADDPWHFGGSDDYPRLKRLPRLDAGGHAATGVSLTATLTLSNWGGDWWYKADKAPHASCSSKVAAGTGTASLSGLRAADSYAYAAYMDSGCKLKLASATVSGVSLSAGAVMDVSARLSISSIYSGQWWYKGSEATATCTSVADGTRSVDLSSLEAGASLTYRAYGKAGCGAADEIASVAFATPKLAVSAVTDIGATLVPENHAGAWWHKGSHSSAVCVSVSANASADLAGLTPGKSYTYGLYGKAGCRTADERASVTFATLFTLAVSAVTDRGATLAYGKAGSAWWYKGSQLNATCVAVSANTTAALSSLTPGVAYTYTVYGEAGCASADDVGSATFSTLKLSASAVTGAGATLTLANHSGAWWHKGDQLNATCVSVAANTTTATLSSLTPGVAYTYKAYDEAGCAAADLIATAASFVTPLDYDIDGDGLIEVSNLEQLNAVRWDLDGNGSSTNAGYATAFPNAVATPGNMGCPSTGCDGYELAASLDFSSASSYASGSVNTSWTTGSGWTPLGDSATKFTATFDGNGRVVANLFISNASGNSQGLFGMTGDEAEVLDLGVASASVRGSGGVGALVGENAGRILRSWSSTGSGEKVEGWSNVGGLVGVNRGAVVASRSAAAAAARTSHQWATVGGLVGQNFNRIVAARASGGVTGLNQGHYGGLVGYGNGGSVEASYAAGAVTSTGGSRGGLIGGTTNAPTVTASYWDTDATGIADDGDGLAPEGRTTTQLQAPTGYAGLYADWNVDLDFDDEFDPRRGGVRRLTPDDPWHFGGDGDYPRLRGLPRLDAVATGLSTASLTLSDWSGDWWYQADAAPHANCSSKVDAGKKTADLSGLPAGTDYVYAAYMDAACSVEIASASLKRLPSAPGKPTATAEDRRVALTWTSGGDSGSPIIEWQVSRKTGDGAWGAWEAIPGSGSSTTGHTVTGLTNGTTYKFRVRAVSGVGNGAASPASGAASPALSKASAPPAPGKPTVVAGDRRATLGWTSNGDGGSAITRWEYVKKAGAGAWETTWTAIAGSGPSTTGYTVTGLTGVTEYRFKVRAVNAVGNGAESSASDAVTPSAAPALAAAATSATAATLTLSNWSAVWHYKADKAPHASCSSQVAANAAASLTGLSSGGVYAYAAYGDSGCATRLATATLSMPSLSAQRKSATEATLTLSNWSAIWRYKATAGGGPHTACSSTPVGTPTKDLSGLTTDTTYTYKAYADSACSSAKELGSATFTAGKTDYDADDNGLIEISTLEQLNAVRWDLDGDGDPAAGKATDYAAAFPNALSTPGKLGCPSTDCKGYELAASLDFDDDASYADTSNKSGWTTGTGWTPLGDSTTKFTGTFDGNGWVVANLFINRSTGRDQGLFGYVGATGKVLRLGVASASVRAQTHAGALAGVNEGTIRHCWSSTGSGESVKALALSAGGLVGRHVQSTASIAASRSTAAVALESDGTNPSGGNTGGLVGFLGYGGRIVASHAGGSVTNDFRRAGGLVGVSYGSGSVVPDKLEANYATGAVTLTNGTYKGGLVGHIVGSNTAVVESYWDEATSGIADELEDDAPYAPKGRGKTTAELKAPLGYSGIYLGWNTDLGEGDDNFADGDRDAPWHFGGSGDYPRLKALPRLDAGDHAATGVSLSATLALSSWGGDWWYKADKAPHANCSSKVAAGTATASLSGLRSVDSYAYAAYIDSGCKLKLASASVSGAVSLVVRRATGGLVRLSISSIYSGQWWYKGSEATATCTSVADGTRSVELSSLEAGASLTYKAYGKAGCGAADEIASVAFTTPKALKLSALAVTGTGATLTVSNHSGAWWHKGSHSSAVCVSVPANTTTAALSALTPGRAYTYGLYGKAGCASADELTSATFTTPKLSATAVKDVGATLTLTGHSAAWWHKRTAPTAGVCVSVSANTSADVSSLTPGRSHAYKAYDKAGCASADELTAVAFTTLKLSASSVTGAGATLALTGYSGAWWHKGSQLNATCVSVPANTSTAALSTLTAGTTYTYRAYGKSGCASSDLIATAASFTTLRTGDYDADDNGLIEISNLEQLNAVRWDLDGNGSSTNAGHATAFPGAVTTPGNLGCPSTGCDGYELAANLDFDDDASYADTSNKSGWTTGTGGWTPLGDTTTNFTGTFDGNGRVVANLYINRPTVEGASNNQGLFGVVGATGKVLNLGVAGASVIGSSSVGALVGSNAGTIRHSWSSTGASEQIEGKWSHVGGLVGANHGTIAASGSSADVTSLRNEAYVHVGGLAGSNHSSASIVAARASGAVAGGTAGNHGGLLGNHAGGTVEASYATGAVTGTGTSVKGGLIGKTDTGATVMASYWDTTTTGIADDGDANPPEGRTTTQLRSPTATRASTRTGTRIWAWTATSPTATRTTPGISAEPATTRG